MTSAPTKKRGLGRGLNALFQEEEATNYSAVRARDETAAPVTESRTLLKIGRLQPGKYQPRRKFDEEAIAQLVASIKAHGVLQPLLVRPLAEGDKYEIIAGERRWRAAQKAQLHEVPVIIHNLSDSATLEIALIENLQREDLTALEEAEGYKNLIDEFDYTQEELAKNLGRSRSHIANTLRLLALPDAVKKLVQDGSLSAGHARTLVTSKNAAELARAIVKKGLSVRQTERLVAKENRPGSNGAAVRTGPKDVDTLALEQKISTVLGLKVSIDVKGAGGTLTVHYRTLDQLDDVLARLSRKT